MGAHTPGPWMEFSESGDWWINQADKDGSPTAFGYVCNSEHVSPEDVRLICAAPDLLEACEAAVRTMTTLLEHPEPEIILNQFLTEAREWLQSEIAKATKEEA